MEHAQEPILELRWASDGPTPILHVAGDIDLASSAILREALETARQDRLTQEAGKVVVDLAAVEFMDSTGLGLLLETVATGTAVEVRSPSENVRRLIDTTGVAEVLGVQP